LPVVELHRYGVVTLVVVLVIFGELYLVLFVVALLQFAFVCIILERLVSRNVCRRTGVKYILGEVTCQLELLQLTMLGRPGHQDAGNEDILGPIVGQFPLRILVVT
jgi:hypothetical protein